MAGSQYGAFKAAVAEAVVELLRPVRERYDAITADPDTVDHALARGAAKAQAVAAATMARVRAATGLVPPTG
jgi:tryptophanyl-tRNA synthetase